MTTKQKIRTIKAEMQFYPPLLIQDQYQDNSSSCPMILNKMCVVCHKTFDRNMPLKEQTDHVNTHSDGELLHVLINDCYHSLNCIKPID